MMLRHGELCRTSLVLSFSLLAFTTMAYSQCSGDQAPMETTADYTWVTLYVAPGQHFHLNVSALSNGFSTKEAADIINGVQQWAGVNGITFDYLSAPPGPEVITFKTGAGFNSVEYATYSYGNPQYAFNQIVGGLVQFDLNYIYTDPTTTYRVYDPSAPNADSYLAGTASHAMGHILGLNDVKNAGLASQTSNSVMGGSIGPNNNGLPGTPSLPTSMAPTDCDKQAVANQGDANLPTSGVGTGVGGGPPGEGCGWYTYEEWDDDTNTLTSYVELVC